MEHLSGKLVLIKLSVLILSHITMEGAINCSYKVSKRTPE